MALQTNVLHGVDLARGMEVDVPLCIEWNTESAARLIDQGLGYLCRWARSLLGGRTGDMGCFGGLDRRLKGEGWHCDISKALALCSIERDVEKSLGYCDLQKYDPTR